MRSAGESWPRLAGEVALALMFAAGALRLYLLTLPKEFIRSALVAEDVVRGLPPWRIFQSRVLGPWLVHAMSDLAHTPPAVVYGVLALALLFACGFLILRLGARLGDASRPPLGMLFAFYALLCVLLPCIWLYVWDLISLVVFVLFNFLVLRGAGRTAFALLFAVGIFNHEIALAIAAWIALDPWVKRSGARDAARAPFDRATAALGLGLLAGGAALVEFLRRALLVREVPPEGAEALGAHGGNVHFTLARNWDAIAHSFSLAPQSGLQFVVPLFLALVLFAAFVLARSDWPRFGALAIVTCFMVVSILCFGLILETRVLLPLVPFAAMNAWAVCAEGLRPRSRRQLRSRVVHPLYSPAACSSAIFAEGWPSGLRRRS